MEDKGLIDEITIVEGQEAEKTKNDLKLEAHTKRCEELAKEYSKSYPKESEFNITTDYQVFLGDNKNAAQNHQRSCKGGGEVVTIKVK
ncbi:MAG: hypothetical protein R3Y50_06160 [Rikenellaceae bacterium]